MDKHIYVSRWREYLDKRICCERAKIDIGNGITWMDSNWNMVLMCSDRLCADTHADHPSLAFHFVVSSMITRYATFDECRHATLEFVFADFTCPFEKTLKSKAFIQIRRNAQLLTTTNVVRLKYLCRTLDSLPYPPRKIRHLRKALLVAQKMLC